MPETRKCELVKVDTGAPTRSHEFKVQDASCRSVTQRSQGKALH